VRSWLRPFWEQDWLAPFCLILLLAVAGYGFLLRPGEILYTPHSDIVAYHIGVKEVLFRSWHAGRGLPFWRADQLAGGPALTNPNGLYTYPLHFLFYLLPPPEAMGWTIWLHLVIGAWVYYALGRALGLGRLPKVLMAAAGLFNFKVLMAVYAGWLSFLPSITFFPLLFSTIFRIVKRPGPGTALAVAATGALTLHGGHIQLVYYAGWFLVAYVLITQVESWRAGQRHQVRQVATWLCGSGLLAIGIAAYLLLPLAAEAPLISRDLAWNEFLLRRHALGGRHLLTLLRPEALGSPLDGSYPGVEMWEDVAYFGLLPHFIGHGLGAYLLSWAVDDAWRHAPERLWLHTCSLDHPRALRLYQRAGFVPYKQETKVIDDPRDLGLIPAAVPLPQAARLVEPGTV